MNGRVSQTVRIGGFAHVKALSVGGDHPVAIQTMWKDSLAFSDIEGKRGDEIAARIRRLEAMGCGLLRFAVPDMATAEVVGNLAAMVSMPLVADIHFDYKIALRCMDFPIAKIRLNPGNIGGRENVRLVLEKAGAKGIPIRIGVNAGSLPRDLRERVGGGADRAETLAEAVAEALVEAAERELALFKEFDFNRVLVSMKASGIADTIRANRILAERTDAPLHIGVTEAGPLVAGVARNAAALLLLLRDGIGDTVRVSLSGTMENEIMAGREIMGAAAEIAAAEVATDGAADGAADGTAARQRQVRRLRRGGVTIVSCPRCGRHGFDTHGFTSRWLDRLYALDKSITVAIMGCEVNGPQEAKHADLGITGAGDKVLIFRHGNIVRTIAADEADGAFAEELALE